MKLIKFGNKKCFSLDDETVSEIKKQLILRWDDDLKKTNYTFLKDISELNKNMHIYLNSFGHYFYLYFTKYKNNNYAIFIDKKKGSMYSVRFRTKDTVFYDTLFEGDYIKLKDGTWEYHIIDIIAYCGEDVRGYDFEERMSYINEFLSNDYMVDPYFDCCKLKRIHYFPMNTIEWLSSVYIKTLKYRCNGLNFKDEKYGKRILYIFEEFQQKEPKKPISKMKEVEDDGDFNITIEPKHMTAVLALKKTSMPDVYDLYANDGEDFLESVGTAYIKDIEHSQYILKQVNDYGEDDDDEIPFKCEYNIEFHKWMPVEYEEDQDITIKHFL